MKANSHVAAFVSLLTALGLANVGCASNGPTDPIEQQLQVIRGFGGVNMPGWIPDLTEDQVNKAFGTGPGQIGLSILRIRIPYDSSMFSLEVPTVQRVKALGVTTVFASPWTPPAWMKSNGSIVGGTLPDSSFPSYAAHLKSFADFMARSGAPLYAVSLQNEPDATVGYESCHWTRTQMLNFVRDCASLIGTKIIMPESMNFNQSFSDPVLNDPVAVNDIDIIGGHIYGGGLRDYLLATSKGKEVWMTEHLFLETSWTAALLTGREIHNCMIAGMNAYVWWYIRRYYGLIDENGQVTKRGYVVSQFARFVRPGAVRVNVDKSPQQYVFVTGYISGSKAVLVAINDNEFGVQQYFPAVLEDVFAFESFETSETKNCARGSNYLVSGNTFLATLEAKSITTFVSD